MIQSEDAKAAESLRAKLIDLLRLVAGRPDVRKRVPDVGAIIALLTPKVEGDRLIVSADEKSDALEKTLTALLLPLRESEARVASTNDLKNIALAMHNYYGANKHFPLPASRGPDGQPLLSWRVLILPYLGQGALFKRFHLDEPWDSPHNRTLIDDVPSVYRLPLSKTEGGRTNYLLPVGNGAVFDAEKPTAFNDIKDGASNTIMVVTVDDRQAVIWTRPDDWPFDPKDPAKGLGRFFGGSSSAALCDGSVSWFKWPQNAKDVAALRAMFTRAGGERIGW